MHPYMILLPYLLPRLWVAMAEEAAFWLQHDARPENEADGLLVGNQIVYFSDDGIEGVEPNREVNR